MVVSDHTCSFTLVVTLAYLPCRLSLDYISYNLIKQALKTLSHNNFSVLHLDYTANGGKMGLVRPANEASVVCIAHYKSHIPLTLSHMVYEIHANYKLYKVVEHCSNMMSSVKDCMVLCHMCMVVGWECHQ